MQNGTLLAAVDLGSNSFRLEISRYEHGQIQRVEYLKEMLRQGASLDINKNLSQESMEKGWECLARFAERLKGFAAHNVRAVATQTMREAQNSAVFLSRGSSILGYPIEIISGLEEARLIYQGVSHLLAQSDEKRLVVDIGGRSTELILGQQFRPTEVASYPMGSVSWSKQFFIDGALTAASFKAAEQAARALLAEAYSRYPANSWETAYGSSGTAGAIGEVLEAAGYPTGMITRAGLDWIYERLMQARSTDRVQLEGLKDERRSVIGGGIAIMRATFDVLGIDEMHLAQGALRQGALFNLIDREQNDTDLRAISVKGLVQKYRVDELQAQRVQNTALALLAQLEPYATRERVQSLGWAAQLHEVGSIISHIEAHKHGAYILNNTDAAGFGESEWLRIVQLVLGHRGKLRKVEADMQDPGFAQQLLCLRLATALCHGRREPDTTGLRVVAEGSSWMLHIPPGWSQRFPQSAYLLNEEMAAWAKTPRKFRCNLAEQA